MGDLHKTLQEYRLVRDDYKYNPDITDTDEERVRKLKYIINNLLSPTDKVFIILYAECQSLRKLGAKMGVSHQTIGNEIRRIKKQIIAEYTKIK